MTVLAAHPWPNNGALIKAVADLGYLRKEWATLDPTHGPGVFWKRWRPDNLVASDLKADDSPIGRSIDFRSLPFITGQFTAVVLDGPYKLNGTSQEDGDQRYGVDVKATWQERHQLIRDGITECARVLRPVRLTADRKRGGFLLVKCQDQVCSGAVRWQTIDFTAHAATVDLTLVDRFQMLGTSRPQPPRSRKDGKPSVQKHAHGHPSSLLVFRKTP